MPSRMPNMIIQPLHGSFLTPSLEHATVGDAMHPGIVACSVDATLTDVARTMSTQHVHCVVVMHEAQDGADEPYVWGILSDVDLIRAGIRPGGEDSAGALAEQPTISVKTTVLLRDAAGLMLAHGVSHVIVIQPETLRPVGVLSTLGVVGVLAWGET